MSVPNLRDELAKVLRGHVRKGYDSYECRGCGGRIQGTSPKAVCNHQVDAVLAFLAERILAVCERKPYSRHDVAARPMGSSQHGRGQ